MQSELPQEHFPFLCDLTNSVNALKETYSELNWKKPTITLISNNHVLLTLCQMDRCSASIHQCLYRYTSRHWLASAGGRGYGACQFTTLDRSLWRSLWPSVGQAQQWV